MNRREFLDGMTGPTVQVQARRRFEIQTFDMLPGPADGQDLTGSFYGKVA